MSKNQSQETSKGQEDAATRGAQGTTGAPVAVSAAVGASHVSSKGTPGVSDRHLKAQTQTFGGRERDRGLRNSSSYLSPAAGAQGSAEVNPDFPGKG